MANKKNSTFRNIFGNPYLKKEREFVEEEKKRIRECLQEHLKGIWPTRPKSKDLLQLHPDLLKLSAEERRPKLRELKRNSVRTAISPLKKYVFAGLKSCLQSYDDLAVLCIDASNSNAETLKSALSVKSDCEVRVVFIDELSEICRSSLGFPSLALGFKSDIRNEDHFFHPIYREIQSLFTKKKTSTDDEETVVNRRKSKKKNSKRVIRADFGEDFIGFSDEPPSKSSKKEYQFANVIRRTVNKK